MRTPPAAEPTTVAFARALSHPLRHQLFLEFHREPTSPSRAAKALGARLNVVSYHTKVLLDCGCIELVDSRRVRGAVEHVYRATREPILEDEDWAALPLRLRRAMTQGTLSLLLRDARAAALNGGFDVAATHMSRTPLELDSRGRAELNERLRAVMDAAIRIQAESAARAADGTHTLELVMLYFDRVSPTGWERAGQGPTPVPGASRSTRGPRAPR